MKMQKMETPKSDVVPECTAPLENLMHRSRFYQMCRGPNCGVWKENDLENGEPMGYSCLDERQK